MANSYLSAPRSIVPIAISGMYPDGSPILWVQGPDGKYKVVASNAPDPDGLVVFRINSDGTLSGPSFHDGGAGSPFYIAFLHNRPDTFVIGYAVGDGVAMGHIDEDGRIGIGPLEPIDTSNGKPAELCWLSVSPDDRSLYGTNFGYSNISSFRPRRRRNQCRQGSRVPESSGRWHGQGSLRRHHQRPERQLDHAGRRISVSDLRECLETGGLRHSTGWLAQRSHQREDSLQQPAGIGGVLMLPGAR